MFDKIDVTCLCVFVREGVVKSNHQLCTISCNCFLIILYVRGGGYTVTRFIFSILLFNTIRILFTKTLLVSYMCALLC